MNAATRLALFAAVLGLVLGGAALAGAAIDPVRGDEAKGAHMNPSYEHSGQAGHGAPAPDPVRGLSVAGDGLRLVLDDPELSPGRQERVRFRVVDAGGDIVSDFDVAHERRMHLIVARRDLTGFQHLHPEQARDGSWSADVKLGEPGSYRLFADFSRGGEARTLAADLRVDGHADLRPLPAPEPSAVTEGGYEVRLESSRAHAGDEDELRFAVSKDGVPVETEPYLGAGGHLVALREGDLAFLHVHPTRKVSFAATFPTEGRYRLFLQFKHDGRVHTAAFTHEVG